MIDFDLYLITDRKQARSSNLAAVLEGALRGGVKAVQVREKDLSSRALYETALGMRELTRRFGARLFINDRIDIALATDADGVHLGGESMPVRAAREVIGKGKLIGVSCHDRAGALAAQNDGADFITFGPVYYTPSKARYGDPVGIAALRETTGLLRIPVFALGGVKRENAGDVIAAGAHGIALISAIVAADNPEKEASAFSALLSAIKRQEPA